MSFGHLGREELLKLLDELLAYQERIERKSGERFDDESSLVRELELHQVELEVQNRELRETQAALEESRDRYADLYDFAPIGYFTLDGELTLREINLTGAALLGKPRDQLIGQDFVSVARVRQPELLRAHLERCAASHTPSSAELWLGREGGSAVQLVSWAVRGARGRPTGYRCAMHDITQRKVAEEQRRAALAAEQRLRQRFEALDRASLAIAAALGAGAPGSVDALLETMASESLRLSRAVYAAIELDADTALGPARVVARSGQAEPEGTRPIELPIHSGTRCIGRLALGFAAEADALGDDDRMSLELLLGRVASAVEIAQFRKREVRERLRLTLLETVTRELAGAASFDDVCQATLRVVRALSPEVADFGMVHFARAMGPADATLAGSQHASSDDIEAMLGHADEATGQPAELSASELAAAGLLGDDAAEDGHLHCFPLRAGERVFGLICIGFHDTRGLPRELRLAWAEEVAGRCAQALERARLLEDLQRAIQTRDGVLAIVSHDLRSPLNAITLSARELAPPSDTGDRRRSRRHIELIRRCAERMDQLIEDLLVASSLEQGQLLVMPRAESVAAVVAETCELLQPIAAVKSVALTSHVDAALVVQGDRKRLIQVLSNLVGNAIKFTPKGGQVVVSCERSGGAVKVSVSDSGPGIPLAQRRLVFERYWTGDSNNGGLGLGLYIAKRVVEAHGGDMWIESSSAGGCQLSFTLPTAS
jgi:PAS domain S-box-containing protein